MEVIMKKLLIGMFFVLSSGVFVQAGNGDAALVGAATGVFGGMLGGAIVNASSKKGPSKAEIEARQARTEAALLRREQERDRVESLKREIDKNVVAEKDVEIRRLNERLQALEHKAPVQDNSHNVCTCS